MEQLQCSTHLHGYLIVAKKFGEPCTLITESKGTLLKNYGTKF